LPLRRQWRYHQVFWQIAHGRRLKEYQHVYDSVDYSESADQRYSQILPQKEKGCVGETDLRRDSRKSHSLQVVSSPLLQSVH
jgi:hypothetical protein